MPKAISKGVLRRRFVYGKSGKKVIGNGLSNFFPTFAGIAGGSSAASGCVNSRYTIKITTMTIIHRMEVTGNCCVFIAMKMSMPVTRLPMPMLPGPVMNPRIMAFAIAPLPDWRTC